MPQLLYAVPFVLEDRELFAEFSCGDEPWSQAAAEWLRGGGVEKSLTQHGTHVWLFRRDSDDQLIGFGSLGRTRRRWPPPTGRHINLLIIPQLAIDIRFHGQPADEGEASMETGGPWIAHDVTLRTGGRFADGTELGREKGEVGGHGFSHRGSESTEAPFRLCR